MISNRTKYKPNKQRKLTRFRVDRQIKPVILYKLINIIDVCSFTAESVNLMELRLAKKNEDLWYITLELSGKRTFFVYVNECQKAGFQPEAVQRCQVRYSNNNPIGIFHEVLILFR